MRRTLLLLLVLVAGGGWLIAGAGGGLRREHVTSAGVPLDVVHPSGEGRRPGVVVAHGFSGSAKLMAPFGDTLAACGYPVVLLDFAGHGADTRPLPDQTASTERSTDILQDDLATAVAYLRSLPDVDPSRIALVGHSMGAGAVTRYAAAHPDVTATVAISLPSAVVASAERPARLLTVVGGLEFPGFRTVATTVAAQRDDRAVRVVPGVEHITVLYAPETHRVTADWLDRAFGGSGGDSAVPFPGRRLGGTVLLGLAFLLGLYPLAARLGVRRTTSPPVTGRVTITAVATGAAVLGALAARLLPTGLLPLAIGGYVAAYTAVTGALLLRYATGRPHLPDRPGHPRQAEQPGWPSPDRPHPPGRPDHRHLTERPGRARFLVALPYATAAIAVPVHLGMTHALPVGDRWWLLLIVWAAFALLAYAAERITAGDPLGLAAIAGVFVVVLAAAAVAGLTHGFLVLVLFPLAGLLLWQALWSVFLNRFGAPAWTIALTGSIVVAWPLAVALPLVA